MSKFAIGLDIGRTAVGYAVTDENGVLKRFKGKNMWGISYFGDSCGRTWGGSRHDTAYQRELKAIFSERIGAEDTAFFDRLAADSVAVRAAWYGGAWAGTYSDSCPTVYHLRKKLASEPARVDVRLVYLVLAHCLRYGADAESGIAAYEKHHADLTLLKALYRRYAPEQYHAMFRTESTDVKNYAAYVRHSDGCGAEALYRTIALDIGAFSDDRDVAHCLKEMGCGSFLPRAGLFCRGGSPQDDADVARILERQSLYEPFLVQNVERVRALFARRREELGRESADRLRRVMRVVRELGGALGGVPSAVFFTCDGDAGIMSPSDLSKDISAACGGSVVTYLPEAILNAVKHRNHLIDSRLVNDFFYAQNAFFAASTGLCGASPWTEETIRYAPELLDRVRRTFAFSDFFEAGIPEMRQRGKGAADGGQEDALRFPLLQGRRVRYDRVEYAVSSSGTLLGTAQLVLSMPSVYILEQLRTGDVRKQVCEEDYVRLYDEICEKICRYQPYRSLAESASAEQRSRFLRCSSVQKTVWLFKLLADARAGVPCELPLCNFDVKKLIRVDKSVTGLFERNTCVCGENP